MDVLGGCNCSHHNCCHCGGYRLCSQTLRQHPPACSRYANCTGARQAKTLTLLLYQSGGLGSQHDREAPMPTAWSWSACLHLSLTPHVYQAWALGVSVYIVLVDACQVIVCDCGWQCCVN